MKEKTFKLDIFSLLKDLNSLKAGDIYTKLSDDEKKGFFPLVVMRWMSCTSDERQILLLNEFVNKSVFPLAKHPHLMMRLLQAAATKAPTRYNWISVKSKKKHSMSKQVVKEYFEMSSREVDMLNPFPPADEIIEMAEELGYQKDEITKLKKEL